MQQIANAAGVSRMAVSLALRNSPKISAATGERIRRLADQLGYRPNPMVSALMTQLRQARDVKKPSVLAYVTAFPTEEGWRAAGAALGFHEGARQRAGELGYTLEAWWLRRPGLTERRFCDILSTRNIRGMIVAPPPHGAETIDLEWADFAAATISYGLTAPNLNRASTDHFAAIKLAVRELTALGYRRIGLAIPEEIEAHVREHWMAAMFSYQQNIAPADRVPTLAQTAPAGRFFANWFQEHLPHAVLSFGPECRRVLADLGLRVPEDVGFANLALTAEEDGTAGINQNAALVGAAAVDLVDAQLQRNERGVPRHSKTVLISGEWVPGPTVRDFHPASRQPARVRV